MRANAQEILAVQLHGWEVHAWRSAQSGRWPGQLGFVWVMHRARLQGDAVKAHERGSAYTNLWQAQPCIKEGRGVELLGCVPMHHSRLQPTRAPQGRGSWPAGGGPPLRAAPLWHGARAGGGRRQRVGDRGGRRHSNLPGRAGPHLPACLRQVAVARVPAATNMATHAAVLPRAHASHQLLRSWAAGLPPTW